jgi:hypothetical protein
VRMTPDVAGVRQNLKLIVDHGRVASEVNQNVEANFGATLGGAYAVWRSGIGITRDGRVIYVYGPALSAQSLAGLLQRAGAVEAMELDINPFWTTFEYYRAHAHPSVPPGGAAAGPADLRLPLLLALQPRLHRGIRTVTARNTQQSTARHGRDSRRAAPAGSGRQGPASTRRRCRRERPET